MHSVRQRILEILKVHTCATVAELAIHLDMAPVSVRHHLDILQGDNLIRVERLARTGSVGRPQQVYSLTTNADDYFPDNYAALASGLLVQLRSALPPEEFDEALDSLAHRLSAPLTVGANGEPLSEHRLDHIVEFLNERGYLARWEEETKTHPADGADSGPKSYLLYKSNCPYAGISAEHSELCRMDQALIDGIFGRYCERIQSMAHDEPCCTYRIALEPAESAPKALVGNIHLE